VYLKALLLGTGDRTVQSGDDVSSSSTTDVSSHRPRAPALPSVLVERFIALTCQYEPGQVRAFLESSDATYHIDVAMKLCEQYKVRVCMRVRVRAHVITSRARAGDRRDRLPARAHRRRRQGAATAHRRAQCGNRRR
jgi:hypothetical protein